MPDEAKKIELVQVKINGQLIPIKGFIQDMIGYAILGMLASLKEVNEPREVEVTIKVKRSI